jgi:hypothetical protein
MELRAGNSTPEDTSVECTPRVLQPGVSESVTAGAELRDGLLGVVEGPADPSVLRHDGPSDEGDILVVRRAGRRMAPGKDGLGPQAKELDDVGPDLGNQGRPGVWEPGGCARLQAATADSMVVKSRAPSWRTSGG